MTDPVSSFSTTEFDRAVTAAVDKDRLKILEIAFYIAGVMTILMASIFLMHFTMLLVLGLNPQVFQDNGSNGRNVPPPPGFFLGMAAFIGLFILLGWIFGALQIYTGRCLRARRHHLFVLVISGIECGFIPWGTALGVFALMILNRPSVRALFPA